MKSRLSLESCVTVAMLSLVFNVSAIAHDEEPDEAQANPMADVEITAEPVAEGIYMLAGQGGNIGLSVGDDATFIVDDQYAPLTEKIVARIASITDRPVDYVLNTHWHFDHTGGNENFGKRGALIMAHDNVRKRMADGQYMQAFQMQIDPAPAVALPVLTFNDRLTLHANGQTIKGIHVKNAHTDGDTLVYFTEANVLHMGDTYFNGLFPFIDLESGGSIDGLIGAVQQSLAIGDEATKIIPGHGPLASKDDLQAYHDMLKTLRDRVADAVAEGKSLEQVVAAKPSAEFDATANRFGFLTPDQFVTTIFNSVTATP